MIEKIDISNIVKDHISTLKNYETDKYSLWDFVLFFFVPFLIGGGLVYFHFMLTKGIVNGLVTSLSIFAALLFNLLLLIYDIIQKTENSEGIKGLKTTFLRQIYTNISFCILVAISTVILLLISFLDIEIDLFHCILAFFVYYLVSLFILTLFMILKRIHILLSKEFENDDKKH